MLKPICYWCFLICSFPVLQFFLFYIHGFVSLNSNALIALIVCTRDMRCKQHTCSSVQSQPWKNPITPRGFFAVYIGKHRSILQVPFLYIWAEAFPLNDNTTDSKKVSSVFSRRCMKLVVESSADTVVKLNECTAAAAAVSTTLTESRQVRLLILLRRCILYLWSFKLDI